MARIFVEAAMKSNRARFGGFLFGNRSAAITLRHEALPRTTNIADRLPALPPQVRHGDREAANRRRRHLHRVPQIDSDDGRIRRGDAGD